MIKLLFIIPLVLVLAACNTTQEPLRISTEIVDRPTLNLPSPRPVTQRPVEWVVITQSNLEEKISEIQDENGNITLFAVNATGYENLSLNASELRRYIQQQNAIIRAMKQYYEGTN